MVKTRASDPPGRMRPLGWLAAALVLLATAVGAAPVVTRAHLAMGLALRWEGAPGLQVQLQVNHVPGGGGAYGSGFQVSLRQLSWASLAGGLALAGIGYASDDASYAAMGGMLAPMGLLGLYRTRDSFTYITGESQGSRYTARHHAEDLRYLHENHPRRRDLARGLAQRHPNLHREFLWSLEAFRDPEAEAPADRAFREWCQRLEAE